MDKKNTSYDPSNKKIPLGADVTQKYSVWIPINQDTNYNACNISMLVKDLSSKYGAPVFHPHITMIGGLQHLNLNDILKSCEKVSTQLNVFDVNINNIAIGDKYFQAVYLTFDKKSRKLLTDLHNSLRRETYDAYNALYTPPFIDGFLPHVSVIYGHLSLNIKQDVAEYVKQQLCVPCSKSDSMTILPDETSNVRNAKMNTRSVNKSIGSTDLLSQTNKPPNSSKNLHGTLTYRVTHIAVVSTDLSLPIDTWSILHYIPLKAERLSDINL